MFFFHFTPIHSLPVFANQVNEKNVQETEPSDNGYYELHFIVKCLDKERQFFFQPVTYNNHMLRYAAHALQWSLHKCFCPLVTLEESALQGLDDLIKL